MHFDRRQHLRQVVAHISELALSWFQLTAHLGRVLAANISSAGKSDRAISFDAGIDRAPGIVITCRGRWRPSQDGISIESHSKSHCTLVVHWQLSQTREFSGAVEPQVK